MEPLFTITNLTAAMRTALERSFHIHHLRDMAEPEAWLAAHGSGIRYVLTDGHYGLPPAYFNALPALELISTYGVGYDAIDTDIAMARSVLVTHTPDVLNAEVATTALLLMLACLRNLPAQMNHARSGSWEKEGNLPLARSADNRTIGILGLGRIGKALADKLMPFGARILYSGRTQQDVPYIYYPDPVAMAHEVDVLISVLPGGAATRHLINREVMDALGPQGVLINVGRGSVVDETALIEALQGGRLGSAGLDVFEDEPRIPASLRALPNVVLTPHIGSATVETRAAMGKLAVDNLLQHLEDGSVLTPVPECLSLSG